jgi:dTDP-4-amino-4,6-dideoxygalactose transaminase
MTTAATKPALASQPLPFSPWPHFEDDEIEAAASVLRLGKVNYWTGEEGRLFESEFGTLALELALQALRIGRGDEVITTSRTFIASASCVVMRGARVVCVDVDRDTQNITAKTIRRAITQNTTAIIAVHLAGWPCDMDPIMDLAAEFNLKVIEDCAQSHGATYKGAQVGSIGHMAAFSFCQDKIMTTGGEGGLVTTNDEELWERAWSYKDHGKSYDAVYRREHPPGFRWLHESFGTNWRLTEMQSALGRVILRKLPGWVATRRKYAASLTTCFRALPALRVTEPPSEIEHSYYKYYAFVRPERLRSGWDRDRIIAEIAASGVPCFSGSCSEIYLEKAFPPEMRPKGPLLVAHELGKTSLMFLVHPTLAKKHIDFTCQTVERVMRSATL